MHITDSHQDRDSSPLRLSMGDLLITGEFFVRIHGSVLSVRLTFGQKASIFLTARLLKPEMKYNWSFAGMSWYGPDKSDYLQYLDTIVLEVETILGHNN